jgi:hypothetical protein
MIKKNKGEILTMNAALKLQGCGKEKLIRQIAFEWQAGPSANL